ncbi:MAG: hypothetical protein WAR41_02820 [Azonexus sp.]
MRDQLFGMPNFHHEQQITGLKLIVSEIGCHMVREVDTKPDGSIDGDMESWRASSCGQPN